MTVEGVVIDTDGSYATVRIKRRSACGHECGECRLCSAHDVEEKLLNTVGAGVGDTVTIGTSSAEILKMAFTVYFLPVLGTAFFGFLSHAIFDNAFITLAVVSIWLVLWLLYIKHYNHNVLEVSRILEVVYEKN